MELLNTNKIYISILRRFRSKMSNHNCLILQCIYQNLRSPPPDSFPRTGPIWFSFYPSPVTTHAEAAVHKCNSFSGESINIHVFRRFFRRVDKHSYFQESRAPGRLKPQSSSWSIFAGEQSAIKASHGPGVDCDAHRDALCDAPCDNHWP